MSQVFSYDGKIIEGWERHTDQEGHFYYTNTVTNKRQEDHPLFVAAIDEISSHNAIKYAAYRTAIKMQTMQIILKMNYIKLSNVATLFQEQTIQPWLLRIALNPSQLNEKIQNLFHFNFNIQPEDGMKTETAAELTINFISKLSNLKADGSISLFTVIVILVILCSSRLPEKYRYLFKLIADHNNCINKITLTTLLKALALLPEFFQENTSFGFALVDAAADNCIKNHSNTLGIQEEAFLSWLTKEPQTLVWLSTFYRLTTSSQIFHDAKCSVCQMNPIKGFRYQCLVCFSYDLCQNCFFTGRISKHHKLKHPLQEHCSKVTGRERKQIFIQRIRNNLKTKKIRQPYLSISHEENKENIHKGCETSSINQVKSDMVSELLQTSSVFPNSASTVLPSVKTMFHQFEELKNLVFQLDQKNRSFLTKFSNADTKSKEISDVENSQIGECSATCSQQQIYCLHFQEMQMQLSRLQKLLQTDCLLTKEKKVQPLPLESTPAVIAQRMPFDSLSPINNSFISINASNNKKGHNLEETASRSNITENAVSSVDYSSTVSSDLNERCSIYQKFSSASNNVRDSTSVRGNSDSEWPSTFRFPSRENSHVISSIQIELDEILQHFEENFAININEASPYQVGENKEILRAAADIANILTDLLEGDVPSSLERYN